MPVEVFGLYESHQVRLLAADEIADFLGIVGLAPLLRQFHHFGALAARHFADAVGEEAVGKERKLPAGLGEVGHGGLHARAASAGHRQAELILGGVGISQKRANLVSNLEEEGIEVSHHVLPHGGVDAGSDHAGPRSEKQTFRRLESWILRHRRISVTPGWCDPQARFCCSRTKWSGLARIEPSLPSIYNGWYAGIAQLVER
jgi:hypothetical protein